MEHVAVATALSQTASMLAQNKVPEEVMDAIRCGRLTALRKPDGGVRGIIVLAVARTIAKQYVDKIDEATSPHQYALKTKASCETVAHILQVLTDADPDATVVSVDGIGAFDLISKNAMMQNMRRMDEENRSCRLSERSMVSRQRTCGGRRW